MEKKKRKIIRKHSRGYPFKANCGQKNRLEVTFKLTVMSGGELKVYNPIEPDTVPRVTIIDPSGEIVVSNAEGTKLDNGYYCYDLEVPPDAEQGTWQDIWETTLRGVPVKEIWETNIIDPQPFAQTIMYNVYNKKKRTSTCRHKKKC